MQIDLSLATVSGDLVVPESAKGLVLFAHGSGSSRLSPRNRKVARYLNQLSLATLLVDLLTEEEEQEDEVTAALRFNIPLLSQRLIAIIDWIAEQKECRELPVALFGASTGAAAALIAAAQRRERVSSVVSRGGRPDLAAAALPKVSAPTLLIVGANDPVVIDLNEKAFSQLLCVKKMVLVEGATHLFEEAGALDRVAQLAGEWIASHLAV